MGSQRREAIIGPYTAYAQANANTKGLAKISSPMVVLLFSLQTLKVRSPVDSATTQLTSSPFTANVIEYAASIGNPTSTVACATVSPRKSLRLLPPNQL